jgi:protein gp37
MIDIENGRYWDEGIELISGCTPCSPGCEHCWSVANTRRFHPGFVDDGHFNGRIHIHRESLKRFNTRSPKVFAIWNDLFHEFVPDQFVSEVYGTILKHFIHGKSKNTYLVLTKRPHVMSESVKRCHIYNIWHGLTVCNQAEADLKIPIFLNVPGKKFLSIEPMLGPLNIAELARLGKIDRAIEALTA